MECKFRQWFDIEGPLDLKEKRKEYGESLQLECTEGRYSPKGLPLYLATVPVEMRAIWGTETNPFANPETAGDGGGYYQPTGGVSFYVPDVGYVIVELSDMSCGDFGTREFWQVTVPKLELSWGWCEGSMDDACISTDETIENIYNSVWRVLGLNLDEVMPEVRRAVDTAAYFIEE